MLGGSSTGDMLGGSSIGDMLGGSSTGDMLGESSTGDMLGGSGDMLGGSVDMLGGSSVVLVIKSYSKTRSGFVLHTIKLSTQQRFLEIHVYYQDLFLLNLETIR